MAKRRLTSTEFVSLCQSCGFKFDSTILDSLSKRGLLDGWSDEEYGLPHLFVIARYFDAIRVFRHPWAVTTSDTKMESVKDLNRAVQKLDPEFTSFDADDIEVAHDLAEKVDAYLERIDPFGPLRPVLDLVSDDVRAQLQGVGRRYAELQQFAQELALAIQRSTPEEVAQPDSQDAEQPQPADVHASAAFEEEETTSLATNIEGGEFESAPTVIDTPRIDDDEVEPVRESPITVETPAADESFSRDDPKYRTGRTQDLLSRLENLKADESVAESASDELAVADSDDLETQIAKLNRQRESLMASHDWQGLVDLYESKIDLFPASSERQQVFLTLAQIQEIKLKNPARAVRSYKDAIETGAAAGLSRAYAGLERVGTKDDHRADLLEWIESRMGGVTAEERPLLQHTYSTALRDSGEKQRAFLSYAAFLSENPETFLTESSLGGLESFASEVEDSELESFYLDVLEQNEPAQVKATVSLRAAKHYLERNPILAVKYFRMTLESEPTSLEAYTHLNHLYQEEQNWPDLVELGEQRWRAVPEQEQETIAAQMRHIVDQDIEDSDDALARYKKMVEENPDSIALDWAITAFHATRRYTEAYAFLNRILEQISSTSRRVVVLRTLAEIATTHLSAPEEAVIHYESGLDLAGPRRDLLEGLASIRIKAGAWSEAVPVLDRLTGGDVSLPDETKLQWLVKGVQAAEQALLLDAVGTFKHRIAAIDTEHELLSR